MFRNFSLEEWICFLKDSGFRGEKEENGEESSVGKRGKSGLRCRGKSLGARHEISQ